MSQNAYLRTTSFPAFHSVHVVTYKAKSRNIQICQVNWHKFWSTTSHLPTRLFFFIYSLFIRPCIYTWKQASMWEW